MNPQKWNEIKEQATSIRKGYIFVEGGVTIKSKYNKDFVMAIKALPKESRRWNDTPNNRFWFVSEPYTSEAIAIYERFFEQEKVGGFPVSLAEVSQEDPSLRMQMLTEMRYNPTHCPDCGREMEQDGGHPYCEYCDG